ncbi:TPA: hypothetical protein N0F65_001150 [Lagenidium giganteum]|uniref:Uncharacterized protein n=1 Tax=Lagenidium giganteum TaxID=4803 RepID=A0AAV2YYS8_9STRA|nr:TPA: hypothetical protein N0F65_001150 [Lagenidium giganteum]
MKKEQQLELQHQREVIVQQVMQTLAASGIMPPAQAPAPTVPSPTRRSPTKHTAQLEENLHSLVLHSLEDSGLNFPNVQTKDYQRTVAGNTSQTATSKPKQLILSRAELPELPTEARRVRERATIDPDGQPPESLDLERLGPNSVLSAVINDKSHTRLAYQPMSIKDSPLQFSWSSGKKRSKPAHVRKKPAAVTTFGIVDELGPEDPVEAEFMAIQRKVSYKTLAILEKSKVLLEATKQTRRQLARQDGSSSVTKFGLRMQQHQASLEKPKGTDTPIQTSRSPPASSRSASSPIPSSGECPAPSPSAGNQQTVAADTTASSPTKAATDVLPCDNELLQPPEHPPENEDEWENELARQILTIYTTSVKAKAEAGTQRASSAGSRTGRSALQTTSRSQPSTRVNKTVSLPAIHPARSTQHTTTTSPKRVGAPTTVSVNYSWEPSQKLENGRVVVNMPKVPKPIWFAGTGAVKAVWCGVATGFQQLQPAQPHGSPTKNSTGKALAMCEHRLCEEVRQLEAKHKFSQCIATLESLLITLVRARGVAELETKLWKQLVVTCNAFASRCIDYKKFPPALQLMKQAEQLIHNSILVDGHMRLELLAYLYDTYAHYYYKRRKPHAGLQYIQKAHEIHAKQTNWAHLAKCQLHIANLLSFQAKHAQAMQYMATILQMIEENKLEDTFGGGGASAQKICLAAVCYNNMAIEQLHLREFEAASTSSANAKRLAKLCLSYSNRWLAQFEATSNCVALAIATLMEDVNAAGKKVIM